jgi:hypothetical protein|nr:MAG TPA: hypothetical protein [Caudoviricetes sp.]
MSLIKPTFEDFKATTVLGVVKNIVNWIIDTLVPTYNTDMGKKADDASLATVAKTGSYTDLTNKPTIPPAVTVDQELSTTSTNAIANKAIYNYVGQDSDLIG